MNKSIILILLSLFFVKSSFSQCPLEATVSVDTINCADSSIVSIGNIGSAFDCDFNDPVDPLCPGWDTSASAQINAGCGNIPPPLPGYNGQPGGSYLWMGNNADVPRTVTTDSLNLSYNDSICFDMVYANMPSGCPNAEEPDLVEEGVSLQYSTDGGLTWIDIVYVAPDGMLWPSNPGPGATPYGGTGAMYAWQSYCIPTPAGAQVMDVQVRWIQEYSSTINFDHWGIDNVFFPVLLPLDDIFWVENDSLILSASDSNSIVTFSVSPLSDTTYSFYSVLASGDTCTADINLVVNPTNVGPDLILDCNSNIVQLEALGVSINDNFTWSPITGLSDPSILNPTASPLDTTDYIFTSSCGVDTMTVNVIANYSFSTSGDTTICVDDTAYLEVFGGAQTYTWTINSGDPNSISDSTIANPLFYPNTTTSYTVTTDSAGCIKTSDMTINVSNKNFTLLLLNDAGCNGASTGSALTVSNGSLGQSTYTLTDGINLPITQTNISFPNLAAGNYTVTVNDSMAACPVDTSFTIGGGLSVVIDSIYSENPFCVGDTSGRIEIYIDTNVTTNYSIDGGATTQTSNIFTGLTDGIYNITAQGGTCPAATATDTLSAAATIEIALVDSINLSCFGATDGEIHVTANLGVQPYQFSIDNITFQTDSFFTSLSAGNYAVYAMDDNGCRDSLSTSISEPAALVLNNINVTDVLCNGDSTGSISFDVANGVAPYQYTIDSIAYQSSNAFNNLPIGAYILQATDANGCFSNVVYDTITEPTPLVLVLDSTINSTCGTADGSISVIASGGSGTYLYSIDTGANTQSTPNFPNLTAGSYSILVTDGNGCTETLNVAVSNIGAPTLTISSFDSILCNGESTATVQLSASGGSLPYDFSVDGGAIQSDSLFTNLNAGLHNFTVVDGNTCQDNISITIYEPAVLNLTATQDSVSCFGLNDGEINLVATGGTNPYTYSLNDTSMGQLSANFDTLSAGSNMTYVVDVNGCIDSVAQDVYQADSLEITNIMTDSVNCFGENNGQISFNGLGGIPAYNYSIDGGVNFVPTNTFSVDTGIYVLIIEDANGCLSQSDSVTIYEPTDLELDSVNVVLATCNLDNGSLEVLASGGIAPYSYVLDATTTNNNGLFTNVSASSHTIVVTDANLCTETITFTVGAVPAVSLALDSATEVSCGGAADATVSLLTAGGDSIYNYTLIGGATQSSPYFTGLSGGNNVFVVTDGTGCTDSLTVNIYEPTTLVLSSVQDSVNCNSGSDGQIVLTAVGGGSIYSYSIDSTSVSQTSSTFNGLNSGTYTMYVADENGCTDSVTQTVFEPDTLIITNVNTVNISCDNDGSFTITAQGGTAPYTYTLDGGSAQSSNVFNISTAGTYILGVTDANNCDTAKMTATIVAPVPVTFTIDSATVSLACNNLNNGFIGITASGGTGPYTYSINNGASYQVDSFFTNLSAGTYTVLVKDMFGCESATGVTLTITEPAAFSGNSSATGVLCNGDANGVITINNVSGGTAPYSVEVNGDSSVYTAGMTFTNLVAGTYAINVTDDNNCTHTWNETVQDVNAIILTALDPIDVSCFGAADGEISVSGTGGTPNYDFIISLGSFTDTINSNSTAVFSNLEGTEAGLTYTVSIEDVNGCATNLTQTITQPNQLVITGIDTTALTCFAAADASMTVNAFGGSTPYTYLWTPTDQTGSTATGLSPGVYSVAVTDSNNCTVSASQTILDVAPVLATIVPDSAFVSMGDDVQLGVNVENALGTNLQYSWSPTEGLSCTDCQNPVVTIYNDIAYSVNVTDENGCTSFNFTEVYVTVDGTLFYFIPNAFSPNGDGLNDVFNVLGQDIQNVDLKLFNRWGEKVFEGSNQYVTWDGSFKGEMQSSGVYSYVVVIKFLNDVEVVKKGSVTLLR